MNENKATHSKMSYIFKVLAAHITCAILTKITTYMKSMLLKVFVHKRLQYQLN